MKAHAYATPSNAERLSSATPINRSNRLEREADSVADEVSGSVWSAGRSSVGDVRRAVEPRIGCSLANIRIQHDQEASRLTSSRGARAMTLGNRVYLNAHRLRPRTLETLHTLAHEMVHVAHQSPLAGRAAGVSVGAARGRGLQLQSTRCLGQANCDELVSSDLAERLHEFRRQHRYDTTVEQTFDWLSQLSAEGVAWETDVPFRNELRELLGPDLFWVAEAVLGGRLADEELAELYADNLSQLTNAPVPIRYFPGQSSEFAIVMSGIHGTEVQGLDVVDLVEEYLEGSTPYYNVIVIPELFPSVVASGTKNYETGSKTLETNRNFPSWGKTLEESRDAAGIPTSAKGEPILYENAMLMLLLERLEPAVIVSIHGHDREHAGIFYDFRAFNEADLQSMRCARLHAMLGEVAGFATSFVEALCTILGPSESDGSANECGDEAERQLAAAPDAVLALLTGICPTYDSLEEIYARKREATIQDERINYVAASKLAEPHDPALLEDVLDGLESWLRGVSGGGSTWRVSSWLKPGLFPTEEIIGWLTSLQLEILRDALPYGDQSSNPDNWRSGKKRSPIFRGEYHEQVEDMQTLRSGAEAALEEYVDINTKKKGISLGTYGPARGAAVYTVEVPTGESLDKWKHDDGITQNQRRLELERIAEVIGSVLLGDPAAMSQRASPTQASAGEPVDLHLLAADESAASQYQLTDDTVIDVFRRAGIDLSQPVVGSNSTLDLIKALGPSGDAAIDTVVSDLATAMATASTGGSFLDELVEGVDQVRDWVTALESAKYGQFRDQVKRPNQEEINELTNEVLEARSPGSTEDAEDNVGLFPIFAQDSEPSPENITGLLFTRTVCVLPNGETQVDVRPDAASCNVPGAESVRVVVLLSISISPQRWEDESKSEIEPAVLDFEEVAAAIVWTTRAGQQLRSSAGTLKTAKKAIKKQLTE